MNEHAVRRWGGIALAMFLLAGLALSFSDSFHSPLLAIDLKRSEPAAAWWSLYPDYQGWPVPHYIWNSAFSGTAYGWCNAHFYNCPLPSYADVYVNGDPSQMKAAKVVMPGYYFGWQPYQGPTYTGSLPTINAGQPVTIEWACQDWNAVYYNYAGSCNSFDAFGNCTGYNNSGVSSYTFYDYNPVVINGIQQSSNAGTKTVYPSTTTTYNLYCPTSGWRNSAGTGPLPSTPTMSFTVNVIPAAPPLTATIDAGAGNSVPVSVAVGQPATITARYAAGAGDTLTASAINDSSGITSVPCADVSPYNASCWTQPDLTKTYTFTPSTSGTYTFYAAAKSVAYSTYNNYASINIVAYPPCANGQGVAGSCTSCSNGYVLQGGSCVPQCPNGQGPAGSCTSCDSGYTLQGGNCQPPSASITTGLKASPARVKSGSSTTLSWSTAGMSSCTVKDNAGSTISTQTSSVGTVVPNITSSKTFTLSCSDSAQTYKSSVTVSLIPSYIEL